MTHNALTRALRAYRLEFGPGEDRSAATLQRILDSWALRRRLLPLVWMTVLTCSSVAAAAAVRELAIVTSPGIGATVRTPAVPHPASPAKPAAIPPEESRTESGPAPAPTVPAGMAVTIRSRLAPTGPLRKASHPTVKQAPLEQPSSRAPAAAESSADHSQPELQTALRAESELLQRGRIAMTRGDMEGALGAVDEHSARFPHGQLAEEREALRIQALVAEDRNPEARTALRAFRSTYPASLAVPALDQAVLGHVPPRARAEHDE